MNIEKVPVLNDKVVSKRDLRKLCDSLSYDYAIGGKFFMPKPLMYVRLVPKPDDKNIKRIHKILSKYDVATEIAKCAVSNEYVPNLYEYKQVVRMVIENGFQYAQYREFKRFIYATIRQRGK